MKENLKDYNKDTMYLVYEKNYLPYGDIDSVNTNDMKLCSTKEAAMKEMLQRKEMYTEDKTNGFTFMENESNNNCFVFANELAANGDDRHGGFDICLAELKVNN